MNSFIDIPGMLYRLCMKHVIASYVGKAQTDILRTTVQRFSFVRHAR